MVSLKKVFDLMNNNAIACCNEYYEMKKNQVLSNQPKEYREQ